MLRTHYRQPIDWTVRALEDAELSLTKFGYRTGALDPRGDGFGDGYGDGTGGGFGGGPTEFPDILGALSDDLNTPLALTMIHAMRDPEEIGKALELIGIDLRAHARWIEEEQLHKVDVAAVLLLIAARNDARARKDWKESDRLRDELAALGVALKDGKDGTTWEIKR